MELLPTVDALHWCADAGPKILADEKIRYPQKFFVTKRSKFPYEPIGVVGVIAPWNYPWSIPFGEVAIALMAGNGVVLKPASLTPLLGEGIRRVFDKAGLPEGLVRTVHGGGAIGDALCKSSAGKIFFTGSVEVGRKVGEVCARNLKGSVLELGGKDPMIVCADADLDNAISGALWGGFANAGQTCSGIERVYVLREVAEPFIEGVVRGAQRAAPRRPARLGDRDRADDLRGPVRHRRRPGRGRGRLRRELRCGGPAEVAGLAGKFIAPTVLTGVTHEMRIMREEIFGPVLPIVVVDSEAGGGRARQRLRVRPRRLGLDQGPPEGRADRRAGSSRGWSGSTTTPSPTAPASAPGAASRTPASAARTPSSASTSASTSRCVTWEPGPDPRLLVAPLRRTLGEAMRSSARVLYGRNGERLEALREGIGPLTKLGARMVRKRRNGR